MLLVGLFLLWFTRKQKAGKVIVSLSALMLLTFSYGAVPDILLRSLEDEFPAFINLQENHDVKWVVVLGGGHTSDPKLPVTGQISDASLARLAEGIRICNLLPDGKLILSGDAVFDPVPEAQMMAEVALLLGANPEKLILESDSKDTKDHALRIYQLLREDKFILVTSASHMPRSMALFRKLDMQPIPAPIDYWVKERQRIHPGNLFPNSSGLRKMERVFFEYLGTLWAKLRGQI
jgi:uncharacterized SAM-binding protein YcdF (DUF218 family)